MCASTPYLTGWTRIPLFELPPSFCSCIPLPSSYVSLLSLHHNIPLIICPLSLSLHQSISSSSFLPPLSSLLQFLKLICTLRITSSTLSPSTSLCYFLHSFLSLCLSHLCIYLFLSLSLSSPWAPSSLSLPYFLFSLYVPPHPTLHPSYL